MLNREYYLLNLYKCGNSINVNGKELPIIGLFINNNMFIMATGDKVTPIFQGIRPNHLTYETVTPVDPSSIIVNRIRNLSLEEIQAYSKKLEELKIKLLDDYCKSRDIKSDIKLTLNQKRTK